MDNILHLDSNRKCSAHLFSYSRYYLCDRLLCTKAVGNSTNPLKYLNEMPKMPKILLCLGSVCKWHSYSFGRKGFCGP